MGEEFKDFEVEAPVLTLEPDLTEEKEEITKKEPEKPQEPAVEEPVLSPQEQKIVEDFAAKIDIENTNQILQYGAGTQKKMADFSDAALVNVKTQDLGEAGELLANVVGELKDFDATEEKGFFGFFKKQTAKVETLKNRYTKAEGNVTKITEALEQHQMRLMKDSAVLDKMYEQNLAYFKELSMYILAGKKKLKEVREGKLNELHQKAAASGLPEDAYRGPAGNESLPDGLSAPLPCPLLLIHRVFCLPLSVLNTSAESGHNSPGKKESPPPPLLSSDGLSPFRSIFDHPDPACPSPFQAQEPPHRLSPCPSSSRRAWWPCQDRQEGRLPHPDRGFRCARSFSALSFPEASQPRREM